MLNEFASPKFKTNEAGIENKQLFANSSLHKIKFKEIEKDRNEFHYAFSPKFPEISDSSHLKENYWEQYKTLKPYTVKSYSSLLSSKPFIPNLRVENDEPNVTDAEDIFTTAAGKSINVSNNAMLAAQRLIQGVFQDEANQKMDTEAYCSPVENKQFIKVPAFTKSRVTPCATRNHKDYIGCPPKKPLVEDNGGDTMDKALLEKFFNDTVFDEKEQDITESDKDKILNSKTYKDPARIRKSLGGRRNMRLYQPS